MYFVCSRTVNDTFKYVQYVPEFGHVRVIIYIPILMSMQYCMSLIHGVHAGGTLSQVLNLKDPWVDKLPKAMLGQLDNIEKR